MGNWEDGRDNRSLERSEGSPQQLEEYLREGEHQQQDFKFRIDSTLKIAKTLSSFANTEGGRLLIGVKDNGKVTGVDPEEEYFMIEGAAELYCRPKVPFKYKVFAYEDKQVLEVKVPSSAQRPHLAKDEEGQYVAYLRQGDQNFRANRVLLRFMRDHSPISKARNLVSFGPAERMLFDYLSAHQTISISKFTRMSKLQPYQAEKIMASFLKWGIIYWRATDKGIRFQLQEDQVTTSE